MKIVSDFLSVVFGFFKAIFWANPNPPEKEKPKKLGLEELKKLIAEEAEWLEEFLKRKLNGWTPEYQATLVLDLYNGCEPAFSERMQSFRNLREMIFFLGYDDQRARMIAKGIPILPYSQMNIEGLRVVLRQVASLK